MVDPGTFHRLRAAQHRSVREQELLSGGTWILVCGLAHLLAALYPVFLLVNVLTLHAPSLNQHLHPAVNVALTLLTGGVLLGFWAWSRYAPFRGALGALVAYVLIQGTLGWLDPHQLLVGASFKAVILLGLIHAVRTGFRRHRPL